MSYQVVHGDERGVRLRRTRAPQVIPALGLLFGAVFSWVGAGMLLAGGGQARLIGGAFVGASLLFLIGPRILVDLRSSSDPRELVFDNLSGLLAIVQEGRGRPGFVPFDALEGFTVRAEVHRGTSSSGHATRSVTVHVVAVVLRSGSRLDLLTFDDEAAAVACLAWLSATVKLDRPPAAAPVGPWPVRFALDRAGPDLSLEWRNPLSPALAIFVVLFFGAFFGLLRVFQLIEQSRSGATSDHTRLMLGGGALVLVGVLYNLWKSTGGRHRLVVDAEAVRLERLTRSGRPVETRQVPTGEVRAVALRFEETSGSSGLEVRTSGETAGFTLDVGNLDLAGRLTLERTLNQALQARARGQTLPRPEAPTQAPPFWWEHEPTRARGDGLTAWLDNRVVGTLLVAGAPLPVAATLVGAWLLRDRGLPASWLPLMAKGLHSASCALGLLATFRLWRAGHGRVRATLVGSGALAVLIYLYLPFPPPVMLWAPVVWIGLSVLGGLTLLQLPEEDRPSSGPAPWSGEG